MSKGVYLKQKQEKRILKTVGEKNNEYKMDMFPGVYKRNEIVTNDSECFVCFFDSLVFFLKRK